MNSREVMQQLAKAWQALPRQEKLEFQHLAQKDRERFQQECDALTRDQNKASGSISDAMIGSQCRRVLRGIISTITRDESRERQVKAVLSRLVRRVEQRAHSEHLQAVKICKSITRHI